MTNRARSSGRHNFSSRARSARSSSSAWAGRRPGLPALSARSAIHTRHGTTLSATGATLLRSRTSFQVRSGLRPLDWKFSSPGSAPVARSEGVPTTADNLLDQLSRSLCAVGDLIGRIRPEQWTASTPCTEWTVGHVVSHVVGMNHVFATMLSDQPPPDRQRLPDEVLDSAYQESAAALQAAFTRAGILERSYRSPLGAATGAERLQIRLYDLLAHGWDIAKATGQPMDLPVDAAEQAPDVRPDPADRRRPAGAVRAGAGHSCGGGDDRPIGRVSRPSPGPGTVGRASGAC